RHRFRAAARRRGAEAARGPGDPHPPGLDAVHGMVRRAGRGLPGIRAALVRHRPRQRGGRIAMPWHRYLGVHGRAVSLEHYGASADANTLFKEYGFTPEAVIEAARESLAAAGA